MKRAGAVARPAGRFGRTPGAAYLGAEAAVVAGTAAGAVVAVVGGAVAMAAVFGPTLFG